MAPATTTTPYWAVGTAVMAAKGADSAEVIPMDRARALLAFYRALALVTTGAAHKYLSHCFTTLHDAMTAAQQAADEPSPFGDVLFDAYRAGVR